MLNPKQLGSKSYKQRILLKIDKFKMAAHDIENGINFVSIAKQMIQNDTKQHQMNIEVKLCA